MNHLVELFSWSGNGPYLILSFGAAVIILVANVLIPVMHGRQIRRGIRRELAQRGTRPS